MIKHYIKILLLSFFGSLLLICSLYFIYTKKEGGIDSDFYRGNVLLVVYLFTTHVILSVLLAIYFITKIDVLKPYWMSIIVIPHFLYTLFIFSTFQANGVMVGGSQIAVHIGLCGYSLWKNPKILSL